MFTHPPLEAQDELDKAKAGLKRVKGAQNTLASMQADFKALKPHIDDICSKLGIFAMIWAFVSAFFLLCCFSFLIRMVEMTEQSVEVKTSLNEGLQVLSTKVRNYFVDFVLHDLNDKESCRNSR